MNTLRFVLFGRIWEIDWAIPVFFLLECITILICILSRIRNKKDMNFDFLSYIKRNYSVILSGALIYLTTIAVYCFNFNNKYLIGMSRFLLQFEYVVLLLLGLLFISVLFVRNKLDIIRIARYSLLTIQLVYTYAFYIYGRIRLDSMFNWIGAILFGLLFCGLFIIEPVTEKSELDSIHDPIKHYDQLFSERKQQCDELIALIQNNINKKGNPICISGEWGTGKTSFVNAVINRLKEENPDQIYTIRMNTMELFTLRSMVEHFTRSLKAILKENRVYTGINSSYKKVALAIADMVTEKKVSSIFPLDTSETYIDQLNDLNYLINQKMKDRAIIVIVDDLERCSKELAASALFLIKEISMIDRCIPLYLCDYDHLKATTEFDDIFLSKFFHQQFDLLPPEPEQEIRQIIHEHLNGISENSGNDTAEDFIAMFHAFQNEAESLEKQLNKEETEGKEESEEILREELSSYQGFLKKLQNPRTLIKVISVFNSYDAVVKKVQSKEDVSAERFRQYLEEVKSTEQYFLLAVMKILFSDYYHQFEINTNAFFQYLDQKNDETSKLIAQMIQDVWQNFLFPDRERYDLVRNQEFAQAVLHNPDHLLYFYSKESTQVKQLIKNINEGAAIPESISEVVMVLNQADEKENKNHLLRSYLMNYKAEEHIDDIADMLITEKAIYLVYYTSVMDLFYHILEKASDKLREIVEIRHFYSFRSRFSQDKLNRIIDPILIAYGTGIPSFDIIRNTDYISSAEKYTEQFVQLFSDRYKITGQTSYDKLWNIHRQAGDFLLRNQLYSPSEWERAEEGFNDAIKELKTVDLMESFFSPSDHYSADSLTSKESVIGYLNQLLENVNETEVVRVDYREKIANLFNAVRQFCPDDKEVQKKLHRLVIEIGQVFDNTGDYAKMHYVETYRSQMKEEEEKTPEEETAKIEEGSVTPTQTEESTDKAAPEKSRQNPKTRKRKSGEESKNKP